ncbi:MAG: hypothetical protein L6Q98_24350 [Anaerolineae bacterium]|nr:hypothetical protein [Anaerolineae bacterium]
MEATKSGVTRRKGRSLSWWFRSCLITFAFGLLLFFMLSSLGMAALLRAGGIA